jgi:hypothetical protein
MLQIKEVEEHHEFFLMSNIVWYCFTFLTRANLWIEIAMRLEITTNTDLVHYYARRLQLMLENFLGFLVFKDMVPSYNIALQCAKEV